MIIFKCLGGLDDFDNINMAAKVTPGSLGFSKNICAKNFIDWNKSTVNLNIKCERGTTVSSVLSSGIISYDGPDDYVGLVDIFGKCYYDFNLLGKDAEKFSLMKYFDSESFNKDFMGSCLGQ